MEYYADIAVQIMFLVMLGASLNLLLGYAGEMSMAHAVFYGVGAYSAGLLTLPVATAAVAAVSSRGVAGGAGWPLYPALVVALVGAFVVALVISLPAMSRVRGEYLILLTLAFQIVANQLMSSLVKVTGGPYGLTPIPPLHLPWSDQPLMAATSVFFPLLVVTLIVVAICYGLGESPFGRLLKGIREHETAVRALGKNTVRPKLIVFGVAAAIAGFAGALNASYFQFIAPGTYSLDLSILVIAIVVLGGVANLTGTILAAIVLGVLKPLLHGIVGDDAIAWQAVIYGLALVVLIRLRPQGLLPEGTGILSAVRRLRGRGRPEGDVQLSRPHAVELISDGSAGTARAASDAAEPAATATGGERTGSEVVLQVSGLSKRFGGLQAVSDVEFGLRRGLVTALIGPNGAGKTTIFNLIANTITPDSGKVVLLGEDITGLSTHRIVHRGMARSFQDGRLFERLTARDNVAMAIPGQPGESLAKLGVRTCKSIRVEAEVKEKAERALEFVGLRDAGDRITGDMSFGEQKLVAIARLLATECDVLLLDEPTSGVDPAAVEHVIEVIRGLRDSGKTICLVEHSIHMVSQLADHGIFMDQGKVVTEGTIEDLMNQEQLAEIYFGG